MTTPTVTTVSPAPPRRSSCLPLACGGCGLTVLGGVTAVVLGFGVLFTSAFGAVRAGGCPTTMPVKAGSHLIYGKAYATVGESSYNAIAREVCFATVDEAEAAGYHVADTTTKR